MLRRPLVVGSRGSMGSRYLAILRHLKVDAVGVDLGDPIPEDFDSVIIASPTSLHVDHVKVYAAFGVPMLVEKPLAKTMDEALACCDWLDQHAVPIRMVNQYRELGPFEGGGRTYYNYFRHGADGLVMDCISVVALAEGDVVLREDSPVWLCAINGRMLSIEQMDDAYVRMVRRFLARPPTAPETDYIREAHATVQAILDYEADTACSLS